MNRIPSSDANGGPCRYISPMMPTDEERRFLAPFRDSLLGADAGGGESGIPLEDPECAEGEFNGADDESLWWQGNIYADDLPSERLGRKPVVRGL